MAAYIAEITIPNKKVKTKVSLKKRSALGIAAVAISPLIAFAILWSSLLLILGVMWVGSQIGLL